MRTDPEQPVSAPGGRFTMSRQMIEEEDLLHAAEYALAIVRRTEERAAADGLDTEYQAAFTTLTAYVEALQTATMTSREMH